MYIDFVEHPASKSNLSVFFLLNKVKEYWNIKQLKSLSCAFNRIHCFFLCFLLCHSMLLLWFSLLFEFLKTHFYPIHSTRQVCLVAIVIFLCCLINIFDHLPEWSLFGIFYWTCICRHLKCNYVGIYQNRTKILR